MRVLASLAALALLGACAPTAQTSAPSAAEIANADCAARKGVMQPVGKLQRPVCVVPYADAGKACTDKSQCQGACIADGNAESQAATSGQCQKTSVQFGCFARIENGKSTGTLCVD